MLTYDQEQWRNGGPGNATLVSDYFTVYSSTGGIFTIGSTTGFTAQWSSCVSLGQYLPTSGTAGAFDADLVDATSSSGGVFGGDVAALKLSIDFSDAGFVTGSLAVKFGNLTLDGFTTATTDLNGQTVREFLTLANTALSGGATTDSIAQLDAVANSLVTAFFSENPSTFAQDHLEAPTSSVPESGSTLLLLGLGLTSTCATSSGQWGWLDQLAALAAAANPTVTGKRRRSWMPQSELGTQTFTTVGEEKPKICPGQSGRTEDGTLSFRVLLQGAVWAPGLSGRSFFPPGEIEFDPEIPALAPTTVEMEPPAVVGDEWKPQPFVAAHRPIPASLGVEDRFRVPPSAPERLVRDAHDVKIEVVAGIAQMPHEIPATFAGAIPLRRDRLVGVPEPPDRVHLSARAEAGRLAWTVGHHQCRYVARGNRLW